MSRSAPPVYDFELSFYQVLGIRWETGRRYRKLGVLKADAKTSSGRSLFLANAQTIDLSLFASAVPFPALSTHAVS